MTTKTTETVAVGTPGATAYEHTSSIAAALVAFQKELPVVGKDAVNPHFKSKYADIATISKEVFPILTKHGLAFTVLPVSVAGSFEVVGVLLHTSGEELRASLPLVGRTSQEIGSALTYARRYLLGCLTGVVTEEDDDGNAASAAGVKRTRAVPMASKAQIDEIASYMPQGVNIPEVFEKVLERQATAANLTQVEANKVIDYLADNYPVDPESR